MPPSRSPDNRPVALVTGAARRIGATIARTLHGAGYDLVLHCHASLHEGQALCDELLAARADSAIVASADLADDTAPTRLVEAAVDRFGRLDALVNNASRFRPTPLGTITAADWDELFASNARAPLFLAQAAAPLLRDRGGAIVNLVDIYAERPLPDHPVYVMAKAALSALTLALARDLGPAVRVNAIAPGAILWPEQPPPDYGKERLLESTALKRTGTPADIAGAVLYLLRDATYVTGEILRVDGGRWLSI
ncbi:pteridine reductase [Pseudofulvimonas gallinarii]|uniref:Pteridine reductase n=1 Tax=Pseudofulvimonas gallinarii TaxID=634155 RepID=A0A4R3LFP1_9GAMM|nr:pteridine reductase [Pseudofulvimonas gallinarii]TCS98859.1 pteridine reductase [Pseudofulvimonas gallinarii]THD14341.1 pteridine reductase [Pseudofulvimonas gallinarii]